MIVVPGPNTGDITAVTAGDGLSGGGASGGVTVTLDLNELTAASVADGDFIPIIDTNDSNGSRKEAVADLATLFAGDGITASSSVLAVNVDDSTIETSSDAIRVKDNGISLAKMAGLTRGSMIIGNASGDPAELTKGSANYVLTSDGTDIAWASSSAAVTALNNATANEIVTVGSTTTELDAESTLTFASNKLIPTATAHNAAGTALTMSAGATTAGTTNNIAGGALTFQGGQGKGSGAGGDIIFQTANAAGSGSSLNSLATALTLSDDLSATFAGAVDLGSNTLTTTGSLQVRTIDYSDGDNAITIADGGGTTFAAAVDLGSNTLTSTGSMQIRTIDYSDGDLAITIADGGGVTFAQIDDAHLDSSPTDETVSGITATFTAGEDLVRGEVVYFKAGDSKMWKAVASAAGTMPVAAMAAADISADATGKFLLYGFLADNGTFPAYTVGGDLYAPEAETSSQNVPEQTAPDSDGDFVQVLGYAVTANSVFFDPDQTVVEVA